MAKIIPIIEGQGEIEAVPTLLYKILHDLQQWQWQVGKPYRANSLGRLKKYLASLLRKASNRKDCGALLILLDLDDGCAVETAKLLAEDIRKLNLAQPVAIVFAVREYEAWFLASLPTIIGHHSLPSDLIYEGNVEGKRDVKGWFAKRMLPSKRYNPTIHQKLFTSLIDIELAYENSRSFRRLYHAIEQLLEAAERDEQGYVSPVIEGDAVKEAEGFGRTD